MLAILGTPGPTNTLLATSGAASGLRCSLPLVLAEAAGYLLSILTLGLVLAPVVSDVPGVAPVLRAAVGLYLAVLAVRLWRRGGTTLAGGAAVTPAQVFVTTLLNPKVLVFAFGVVPFGAHRVWPYMLGFLVLLAPVALCWITAGALLGRIASRSGRAGMVPRIGAAAVGVFAALLLAAPLLP